MEEYLVSTCGLTHAHAVKASAKLSHLKSPPSSTAASPHPERGERPTCPLPFSRSSIARSAPRRATNLLYAGGYGPARARGLRVLEKASGVVASCRCGQGGGWFQLLLGHRQWRPAFLPVLCIE
ncbi:hypothetical protein ZWY2020_021641 [Hordeum vulgare]|nr:hypothetical protein ZWY2020_021641 [Hordeum vulgare]